MQSRNFHSRVFRMPEAASEPSFLVRGVLRLAAISRAISPYRLLIRQNPQPAAAEIYVLAWLGLLALCLVGIRWIGWVGVTIVVFRFFDLNLYQVSIMLDRAQRVLSSYPRSLVLTALNLVELTLMTATVARWKLGMSVPSALYGAFNVVVARSTSLDRNAFLKVASALAIVSALLLLAGMLAMLLGLVGQSFRERPDAS